ncbi:hypothetical protein LSTR_LSTR011088 [Laodelphax striatellus]|uniref:Uncharacterized protein n=1 Tax=Laodelphax striatellus TaxID=195883 RepID=A0A482WUQ7_LAOST|nr:hypothetical protein LSTR_LSTR011088 [Laodelphax striatellus]
MQPATVVVFGGLLLAVASAAPQFAAQPQFAAAAVPQRAPVATLDRHQVFDDFGQFSLTFTTADGTQVTKQGVLKPNADGTDNVLVEYGSYRYKSPEGQDIEVEYTADENGFHPTSKAIPVHQAAPSAVFV